MRFGFAAAVLLVGCAAVERPVHFTIAQQAVSPVDAIVRALTAEGLTPRVVNREVGTVQTDWQDTGFGYGFVTVNGASLGATIVRRYTVVAVPNGSSVDITVRMDAQKCVAGSFDVNAGAGQGCQPFDGLVPKHQAELDALGDKLRAALHG